MKYEETKYRKVELVEWKENILINGNEKVDNRAARNEKEGKNTEASRRQC
jgi:hypothetical protein